MDSAAQEDASGSRALVIARGVRERTQRDRRRRQWLSVLIVVGSVLGALAWGAFIAQPRFAAETRFSVRGSSPAQASSGALGSVLGSGAGASAGVGFVDGYAVNDFLKSRDCMQQLAKRVNLPQLLGVAPSAGTEALYQAYRDTVAAKFFMVEQENVIEVSGFAPDRSNRVAKELLAIAQGFVERMDAQGVQNALDVNATQLRTAEEQAVNAANAVAAWRATNRNVDPEAESTLIMTMIGQVEQELNTARINYEKVRAFGNPDHPMLRPAQMQVQALERQLGDTRARLAGNSGSAAAQLRAYSQLKNTQTFADNNLASARDAYQQAYRDATRLRRYLTVISQPVAQDVPSSPNLPLLGLEGLLGGLVLAFLASLVLSMRRPEHA
jgi:capsular polysaccharide transport system permease protein